jgi:hypothetical protein
MIFNKVVGQRDRKFERTFGSTQTKCVCLNYKCLRSGLDSYFNWRVKKSCHLEEFVHLLRWRWLCATASPPPE